jgi:hypothetical protein
LIGADPEPYFVRATNSHFSPGASQVLNDHEVDRSIFVDSRQRKPSKNSGDVSASVIMGYHIWTKAQGGVPGACQISPKQTNVSAISKVSTHGMGNAQKTSHRFVPSGYTVFQSPFDT